jgi:hypothetical protein
MREPFARKGGEPLTKGAKRSFHTIMHFGWAISAQDRPTFRFMLQLRRAKVARNMPSERSVGAKPR